MANFLQIKKQFHNLSESERDSLLKSIYNFSRETHLLLEGLLLGNDTVAEEFIRQMERETIRKVYKRSGIPGTPNGRTINSIVTCARKSHVNLQTMMELEKLAYRGFIEFLNEYGGGPESFQWQGCGHLETYLRLANDKNITSEERYHIFQEVKKYLLKKDNMYTDDLDDVYREVTGIAVDRY